MGIQVLKGNDPQEGTKVGMSNDVANHIIDLCEKRSDVVERLKDLTETKKAYDEAIKNTLKSPQKSTFGEFHISWITTETKRIDTKMVKADYPEVAEACTKISQGDRMTIVKK